MHRTSVPAKMWRTWVREAGPDPGGTLFDLIFIRNMPHHLEDGASYFRRLSPLLKPEGRPAIIDYSKGRGFGFTRLFVHYTDKEDLLKDLFNGRLQPSDRARSPARTVVLDLQDPARTEDLLKCR